MKIFKKIVTFFGISASAKLSKEEALDIEFCKNMIIDEIQKITVRSFKVKEKLSQEISISLIYLKIFSSYLKEKQFNTVEEAWRFMNDIKGIIEKVFYISSFVHRVEQSMEAAAQIKASKAKANAEVKKTAQVAESTNATV